MDFNTQWNVFTAWMRARVAQSDRGATLVEYALLVALIAVAAIVALRALSGNVQNKFSSVGNSIANN
jgi:pilus assembly protein Flp/PilA